MIQIDQLFFGYSPKKMLYQNLSLHLSAGRIYGLLGKNGAGKSTLLKNLTGLLFPVSGRIKVAEHEPRQRKPSFLRDFYFIPEEVYVPPLSLTRYVDLYAQFYPNFDQELFDKLLIEFEIMGNQKLDKISFGQQKKFIIAFGLACKTKLLIMDEPTNGLDIPSKSQFRKLMASALENDRLFIISTHQVRDLDSLIDDVIIIENSQVLLNESIATIAEKLCFKTVAAIEDEPFLYAEDSIKGKEIVMQNIDNEDSKVNLEHLFNATLENASRMEIIFNN